MFRAYDSRGSGSTRYCWSILHITESFFRPSHISISKYHNDSELKIFSDFLTMLRYGCKTWKDQTQLCQQSSNICIHATRFLIWFVSKAMTTEAYFSLVNHRHIQLERLFLLDSCLDSLAMAHFECSSSFKTSLIALDSIPQTDSGLTKAVEARFLASSSAFLMLATVIWNF